MRRYIRSFRTRQNVGQHNALRDQFLRELTRESEALLKQLSDQFTQTLQTQVTQALTASIVPGDNTVPLPGAGQPEPGSIGSFGQLISTGVRYLVSRPRTSTQVKETSRSVDASSQFRLSQSQTLAEMQARLSTGEKNG